MKAIIIDGGVAFDNLRLVDRPMPEPARSEVVLKLRAASLNYRDLDMVGALIGLAYILYFTQYAQIDGPSGRFPHCSGYRGRHRAWPHRYPISIGQIFRRT